MEYDWWRKFGAPRPCGPDAASHNEANENTAMKRISQHLPPPNRLTSRAAALSIAAFAAMVADAAPRVPYANDFSTRTSGATPSDRWMETSYIPGALARPVSSAGDAYNSTTAYQDGWTMKEGLANADIFYMVADDGGNQGVLVTNKTTSASSATVAMQPLYNEFTDGVLKISIDIRTPGSDAFSALMHCYLMPIYKAGLDIAASSLTGQYPMRMGAVWQSDGNQYNLRATMHAMNNDGNGSAYYGQYIPRNTIESGQWIRYEAILDLSAGKATATFADLGTTHPTPETAVGSPVDFRRWEGDSAPTTFTFITPITAETGGVAGLALYARNFKKSDAADAPMFDNVVVSWKAPGADDFAPVYSNDFTTRRYRQIEPAGATTGAYALAPVTNAVQSGAYGATTTNTVYDIADNSRNQLVPARTGSAGELEPAGLDGWRRFDGVPGFALVNPTTYGSGWSNGVVLRVTAPSTKCDKSKSHVHIATPLGTALTSGKVRLYFDLMVPANWQLPSDAKDAWAGAYLGSGHDATLQTGSNDAKVILTNKYACGGGFYVNSSSASNGDKVSKSKWMASLATNPTGQPSSSTTPTYGSISAARWYRFCVSADIDKTTFDIVAWGCGSQSGTVVGTVGRAMDDTSFMTDSMIRFAISNRAFHVTAPVIDSVILSVNNAAAFDEYGTKDSKDTFSVGNYPLFDNIRVCRVNDDGTDGFEIYRNDFDSSVRTSVQDAAVLAADTDRDGADRWIRRHRVAGSMNVIDAGGGDGVVSMTGVGRASNENMTMFAFQPLGASSKNCASVDFAADIRPPSLFSAQDGSTSSGYAYVEVGGDNYYQGVYRPASGNNWRSEPRIGFGFTANSGKDACQQFTNVIISVQTRTSSETSTVNSDAALDTSHWYRFRAKAVPTNAGGTFTVKVYDQGTAKPAASDADGTLVATFANLALPSFGANGMTTFGLAACNFTGTRGGGLDDPNVALVDNLKVDFVPAAMVITIR